jgi:hypothetical protein
MTLCCRSKTHAPPIYTEISDRESVSRRASSPPELVPSTRNVHDYVEIPRNINAINLTLVNRGSVARDHLASERTFLAYVRTSLGLSSAGVGRYLSFHSAVPNVISHAALFFSASPHAILASRKLYPVIRSSHRSRGSLDGIAYSFVWSVIYA